MSSNAIRLADEPRQGNGAVDNLDIFLAVILQRQTLVVRGGRLRCKAQDLVVHWLT